MRILILGGTLFLGRHLVEAFQERAHEVVLFNRGLTNPELVAARLRLIGDRTCHADLAVLENQRFDAVIDTSGYVPKDVRASSTVLRKCADRYVFISSVSVYDLTQPPLHENSRFVELPAEVPSDTFDERYYGPLKAGCEEAVRREFGTSRSLVIRPGLIVGPHDPTDRFSYWPARIARGGDVLAPQGPTAATQFIDVRDLARWIGEMLETGGTGTYNATGPFEPLTLGEVLQNCIDVSGSDAVLRWVDAAFLDRNDVGAWIDLPLWIPEGPDIGLLHVDATRARAAGLKLRPIADTIDATLTWLQATRGAEYSMKAGLTAERESELLARWRASADAAERRTHSS